MGKEVLFIGTTEVRTRGIVPVSPSGPGGGNDKNAIFVVSYHQILYGLLLLIRHVHNITNKLTPRAVLVRIALVLDTSSSRAEMRS